MTRLHKLIIIFSTVFAASCGSSGETGSNDKDTGTPGDDTSSSGADTAVGTDSASGTDVPGTDTPPPPTDAGVRRLPCLGSGSLSSDLPADQYGALEGELVSLVPPGTHGCPNDADHLHLQVDVGGKRYDVAVTINDSMAAQPIYFLAKDIAAGSAAPGWSATGFDYPTNLGAHAADFTGMNKTDLLARLQTELATVSKVSLHGRSYGPVADGVHNVHRNGGGHDGAIIARGLGAGGTDHVLAFHFYNSAF